MPPNVIPHVSLQQTLWKIHFLFNWTNTQICSNKCVCVPSWNYAIKYMYSTFNKYHIMYCLLKKLHNWKVPVRHIETESVTGVLSGGEGKLEVDPNADSRRQGRREPKAKKTQAQKERKKLWLKQSTTKRQSSGKKKKKKNRNQNSKHTKTGDWRHKRKHEELKGDITQTPTPTMNWQSVHGEPRLKYTDTLVRERGTRGERGGRRTGETMRGRHRGESMKETILTDRGRQTCNKGKTEEVQRRH